MVKSTTATFLLTAALVSSHPLPRQDSDNATAINDTTILNFALTLEHLESAFYAEGLANFTQQDFLDAGLPEWSRGRFVQIGEHEKAHVAFLSNALGDAAVQPCNYTFPYTDAKSFSALSQVLEGVGVSAYAGAAQLITNKDYLTAAAVVLSTEARHAAWVAGAVNKGAPWGGPLDTPLDLNTVYSLAAPFITSCPSTNSPLPVLAFPPLTISPASPKLGSNATLSSTNSSVILVNQTAIFYTGLTQTPVNITEEGVVMIPEGLEGMGSVYVNVVDAAGNGNGNGKVIAGVAVLDFSVGVSFLNETATE